MTNKNYEKGKKKENKICRDLRERQGFEIAQRSAGSHSPIDIFAINKEERKILFVQSKPENFSEAKKKKLYDELNYLNDWKNWNVRFEVL